MTLIKILLRQSVEASEFIPQFVKLKKSERDN